MAEPLDLATLRANWPEHFSAEKAKGWIAACDRIEGLIASQGDERPRVSGGQGMTPAERDLRALVEHEQAEMEQWLDVITDPPCRHDRSSSAQHKADNLVTYGCPGYEPIGGAELAAWLRRVRDEMRQWERPEVKRARAALAAEEERG